MNFLPLIVVGLAAAYVGARKGVDFLSRSALIAVPGVFILILAVKAVAGSTRSDLGRDLMVMGALWTLLMFGSFVGALRRRGDASTAD